MDGGTQVEVRIVSSLDHVDPADWDTCAGNASARPENPFLTHRFLRALESSGSVGEGTGWQPHHLVARLNGQLIGVMPLYAKSHSQGEYIFDHNWAHAYLRNGGRYYPKLQAAVPFTPVTGRRFLAHPALGDSGAQVLMESFGRLAEAMGVSSAHVTFCTEAERRVGEEFGFLGRITQQFHWLNRGYASFDEFLADLASRKRKQIRKERTVAQAFGGDIVVLTGDAINVEHWDAFWRFYQDTGARKWGTPYLTRAFFQNAHETLRDDILLVMARRQGRWIAGALNFIGSDALYGRYWGAEEAHDCLHFEMCYYRAIDYAIENALSRVEAGAQGAHKLARGYMPKTTHSLHWFADPRFKDAVAQYLEAERAAEQEEIEVLTQFGPFRRDADSDAASSE
jgi:uncharacterized protein